VVVQDLKVEGVVLVVLVQLDHYQILHQILVDLVETVP
tara:strand:+ start:340 stop:453 length:114 start_codon:yes stop_codon:yes gene_type:complete